jgi:ABC-2 type transport system ATP-binding protein
MGPVRSHQDELTVPVHGEAGLLEAIQRLHDAGVAADEIALRRPTLDEVFLNLTNGRGSDARAA